MCDDIDATLAELRSKGAEVARASDDLYREAIHRLPRVVG